MKTIIRSAGCLESLLAVRGEACGAYEYSDEDAALAALVSAGLADEAVLYEVDDSEGRAWLVYGSREECDADSDGSSARATIVEVAS